MPQYRCQSTLAVFSPAAVAFLASMLVGTAARTAPIEFGNFHLLNATRLLSFTNNGGTSGTLQALSVPVIFDFTVQSGLPTIDHAATLTINPVGTLPTTLPAIVAATLLDQPIRPLDLSITENGTGKNLLTMISTGGDLVGFNGGVTASVSGMNSSVYTSDFATFNSPISQSYNLGLATLSVPLSVGPGGFLNSFTANVDGQFSFDGGLTPKLPEPATVALFGMGALAVAALAASKRRRGGARA
jgi:hypothetical protein